MSLIKHAVSTTPVEVFSNPSKKIAMEVKEHDEIPEEIVFDDNKVYSRVRAISNIVNLNLDGFEKEELLGVPSSIAGDEYKNYSPHNEKFGYLTFRGKNNHVDHFNQPQVEHQSDEENMKHTPRGEILWSSYHEGDIKEPMMLGGFHDPIQKKANKDCWVELLMANDRRKFPVLCRAIEDGIITKVSMGAEVVGSSCSVCGNFATYPAAFCDHIKMGRGQQFSAMTSSQFVKDGIVRERDPIVAFENNHGLQFFEESWILDVQADPTAIITELVRGEPGFPISGIKAASKNRDYNSMLVDILKLESSMGKDALEKVARILKRADDQVEDQPKVNLNIENFSDFPREEDTTGLPMNHDMPPSNQPGIHFPDYPFPCSAKVSASEANPQYPMDSTIDVEVCQGCMYNKTDKIGAVDCSFPEISKKGGSDPLPASFQKPEESSKSEVDYSSGFRTEDGREVKNLPNTEHPPGFPKGSKLYNEAFYHFKEALKKKGFYEKHEDSDISEGKWK